MKPSFKWMITANCGDFRLSAAPDDPTQSVLSVVGATPADRQRLEPFLAALQALSAVDLPVNEAAGWWDRMLAWAQGNPTLTDGSNLTLKIRLPMAEAGPLLAGKTATEPQVWTAVRMEAGVLLVDGTIVAQPVVEQAVAAATLPAPRRGCPFPAAARRRASEVLRTFTTRKQWEDYTGRGYMVAHGNVTGTPYRIFHRDEAARRGLSRSMTDDQGRPICVWRDDVPPEEESLSLLLAVQFREGFLSEQLAGYWPGREPLRRRW